MKQYLISSSFGGLATHWDLIICGGGPAGLAAAMQAGHAGLKALLIEKSGMLGGTTSRSDRQPPTPARTPRHSSMMRR